MKQKIALIILIGAVISAFIAFDMHQYLSLSALKTHQSSINAFYEAQPVLTIGLFFLAYVIIAAFSLPGAAIMTLAAGALFGLGIGTVLVSFASSLGATCAFLSARWLLQSTIEQKFSTSIGTINKGVEKEGAFYLFTLRLVPLFPFFMINLVMGLTKLRVFTFYGVSQLGMLPGTFVYVNAGTQLSTITSLQGILSFNVLISFALLGIFPLVAKKSLEWIRGRYQGGHQS